MRWEAYEHGVRSDEGYYVVTFTANGRPTGRFGAVRVAATGKRLVLGGYESREEACRVCEAHSAQSREVALA